MKKALIAGLVCCVFVGLAVARGEAQTSQSGNSGFLNSRPVLPAPSRDADGSGLTRPGEEIPAWRARWELARLLSYTKKLDQAVVQYRKLLQEKPELWEARSEMARVLSWQGRGQEALEELEKLPAGQVLEQTVLLKADLLAADKKYTEASKLYRQYLQKKPGDHAARFRLAQVLSWAKDYPASLEEYRLILKERPDDQQLRRHYAFVLSWAGQFEESAKELAKTLGE